MKTIFVILGLIIAVNTFAQQTYLDSLIMSKKPKYIEGIIPVHVIPGYEARAISWQSAITEAKKFLIQCLDLQQVLLLNQVFGRC